MLLPVVHNRVAYNLNAKNQRNVNNETTETETETSMDVHDKYVHIVLCRTEL